MSNIEQPFTAPASAIANTPAGGIAATTVQAAIDELDADKAAADLSGAAQQTALDEKVNAVQPYLYALGGQLPARPVPSFLASHASGTTKVLALTSGLTVGTRRNVWINTESLANAQYLTGTSTTKGTDSLVTPEGITLTKITGTNFYSSLRSAPSAMGTNPFTIGQRYLFSCYVLNRSDRDQFVWMRSLADSSSKAHGPKLLPAGRMTRIWILGQATTTQQCDFGPDPVIALGSGAGTGNSPYWFFAATPDGTGGGYSGLGDNTLNLYIGGFSCERTLDSAKDGIAGIGDSTMQGAAGNYDAAASREWMGWLAGMLNAPTYNRGVSGNTLAQMDARWATDITPLAATAKYVIIQGGINDINSGRTLVDMQASMASMAAKAFVDGLIPIVATCTPFIEAEADAGLETIRTQYNTWVRKTYALVADLDAVAADPFEAESLRRATGWYGDGKHFGSEAKRAIAAYLTQSIPWDLPRPSEYQPILSTTYAPPPVSLSSVNGNTITTGTGTLTLQAGVTFTGPAASGTAATTVGTVDIEITDTTKGVILKSPDGTRYRITVANGGALSTAAV